MNGYFPRYFWPVPAYTETVGPLFDAIYARYLATTFKDKITALYNTEADAEATYPYATFSLVSDVTDWSGSFEENDNNGLIQFTIFDDDSKCGDIIEAYEACKAAYHKFGLVVSGNNTIYLVREMANLFRIEDRWAYNVSFRILINEI